MMYCRSIASLGLEWKTHIGSPPPRANMTYGSIVGKFLLACQKKSSKFVEV